jgi:hypothetical protein
MLATLRQLAGKSFNLNSEGGGQPHVLLLDVDCLMRRALMQYCVHRIWIEGQGKGSMADIGFQVEANNWLLCVGQLE